MPKIVRPLTDTQVKQSKPADKIVTLFDGEGLVLRIHPNGSKKWVFNYSHPHTKKRTSMGFGSYPAVSLAAARGERSRAKELLAQGIDPKHHRDEVLANNYVEANNTLDKVTKAWLEVKKSKVSVDHAAKIYRSIELHVLGKLGKTPIKRLKAPMVIEALGPLAARGNLETVRRICQRINEVMYYAVNTGLIDSNPLARIAEAFQTPIKQHMPSIHPDELPRLMRTLASASITLTTRCVIEWQLHTMTRPGESAKVKWSEIDWEQKLWVIPAEKTKTKQKQHAIPLTDATLALLEIMKPISCHRDYVFPSSKDPKGHINKSSANAALKRMGFKDELVAHGLRSVVSTAMNEEGLDSDLIEKGLSHIERNEVRRAYNRAEYIERRRPMMEWWSQRVVDAASGNMSLAALKK